MIRSKKQNAIDVAGDIFDQEIRSKIEMYWFPNTTTTVRGISSTFPFFLPPTLKFNPRKITVYKSKKDVLDFAYEYDNVFIYYKGRNTSVYLSSPFISYCEVAYKKHVLLWMRKNEVMIPQDI